MDLLPVGPRKISNGHISGTGRLIDFVFDPRVGFSGTADRIYFRFHQIQDGGWPPSCKILNDHISGMSYPIHFHELHSSFGGIQEKIMRSNSN